MHRALPRAQIHLVDTLIAVFGAPATSARWLLPNQLHRPRDYVHRRPRPATRAEQSTVFRPEAVGAAWQQ